MSNSSKSASALQKILQSLSDENLQHSPSKMFFSDIGTQLQSRGLILDIAVSEHSCHITINNEVTTLYNYESPEGQKIAQSLKRSGNVIGIKKTEFNKLRSTLHQSGGTRRSLKLGLEDIVNRDRLRLNEQAGLNLNDANKSSPGRTSTYYTQIDLTDKKSKVTDYAVLTTYTETQQVICHQDVGLGVPEFTRVIEHQETRTHGYFDVEDRVVTKRREISKVVSPYSQDPDKIEKAKDFEKIIDPETGSGRRKEFSAGTKAGIELGTRALVEMTAKSIKDGKAPELKDCTEVGLTVGKQFVLTNSGKILQSNIGAEGLKAVGSSAAGVIVGAVAVAHLAKAGMSGQKVSFKEAGQDLLNGVKPAMMQESAKIAKLAKSTEVVQQGFRYAQNVVDKSKGLVGLKTSQTVAERALAEGAKSATSQVVGAAVMSAGVAVGMEVGTGIWKCYNGQITKTELAKTAINGGVAVGVDTLAAGAVSAVFFVGATGVMAVAAPVAVGAIAGIGARWVCSKLW